MLPKRGAEKNNVIYHMTQINVYPVVSLLLLECQTQHMHFFFFFNYLCLYVAWSALTALKSRENSVTIYAYIEFCKS